MYKRQLSGSSDVCSVIRKDFDEPQPFPPVVGGSPSFGSRLLRRSDDLLLIPWRLAFILAIRLAPYVPPSASLKLFRLHSWCTLSCRASIHVTTDSSSKSPSLVCSPTHSATGTGYHSLRMAVGHRGVFTGRGDEWDLSLIHI